MHSPPTLLELYAGAYGLTLRIDVQSRGALIELHRILESLSRVKPGTRVALGETFAGLLSGPTLILTVTENRRVNRVDRSGDASFEWTASLEEWMQSAGLVEGLVRSDGPGHQYLADGPGSPILVEFAFQEGRPDAGRP
jgi:hypothetical protein